MRVKTNINTISKPYFDDAKSKESALAIYTNKFLSANSIVCAFSLCWFSSHLQNASHHQQHNQENLIFQINRLASCVAFALGLPWV